MAGRGQDWLFIYDNVEQQSDLTGLHPKGAHLIVTTRQGKGWPGWAVIPAGTLATDTSDGPATRLLMREAARDDAAETARALAEDLGGLPLALIVAGALIRNTGESFATYRSRLAEIVAHTPPNEDYPTSILGAVQLSYDALPEDAKLIADLCAWWAPEGLGPDLLTEAPGGLRWGLRKEEMSEAVQALAGDAARIRAGFLALAERSLLMQDGAHWAMHRTTALALRAGQAARKEDAAASAAVSLLAAVYPFDSDHSGNFEICARLTPHVRALWATGRAPRTAAMDYLLNQSALYLGQIADHPGAADLARASLDLKSARLPEAHRDIALAEANLGKALLDLGDLSGAAPHLDRAMALSEAHRPGTADLAHYYDVHGGLLLAQARAGEAAALPLAAKRHQQALALRRQLFGRRNEPVAIALNNLGGVRDAEGRGAAAARLFAASLGIRRAVLPPGDARPGYALMNTGAAWLKSGAADRAEPLLQEALELRQVAYAAQPKHPETRNAAGWLISCLLTRAREGENLGKREMQARQLCARYGFDFEERQKHARQFPYTRKACSGDPEGV